MVSALGTAVFNMGAAGHFTEVNINTLLGLSDSASNGFRSGATIGLDTTGGSVSYTNAIANPNSGINVLNLAKLGANTLTLEQNNTYTGRTFISAGTLQLGTGVGGSTTGSLSTSSAIRNNGTLTINRSNAVVQGTDFSAAPIIGTGSLIQLGTGTTTLNAANTFTGTTTVSGGVLNLTNALALQNSALVTTGAGTLTLTGPTTLTLGGLSGATGDLATVIGSGYTGTVTALTLNPAGTVTYGGIITNGAMSLTKTGTGTQILQGNNTYTGATIINAGTLSLSGAAGAIAASTGLTLNNGTLTLANTTALEGAIDRVSNTAPITSNGGTVNYTNTSGALINYAESVGAVDLVRGQLNVNLTTPQLGSQVLTLADLTRTGSGNASTVSLTGGPNTTTSQLLVTSKVGSATPAGQIIAPWFNTNGTAAGSADYAVYNAAGQVVGSGTLPSTEGTWTNPTDAYTVRTAPGGASGGGAERLTTTRNMVGLRIDTFSSSAPATLAGTFFTRVGNTLANGDPLTFAAVPTGLTANIPYYVINKSGDTFQVSTTPGGSAATFTAVGSPTIVPGILLGAGANLGTTGILQQSGVTTVIAPGTGGVVTLPSTASDNLYINTGGNLATGNLTILAPVTDNDAGVLTLVKSGLGTLALSGNNTYTGGTVLNAGTVAINNANGFGVTDGATTGAVTVSGSSRINAADNLIIANPITVIAGRTLTLAVPTTVNNSVLTATFSGVLSGTGDLFLPNNGGNGAQGILAFTNTANTFSGNVVLSASGTGNEHFQFKSLGDAGNFTFAKNGNRQLITYTGSSNLTFITRQIVVADTMFGTTDRQGMDGNGANPVNVFSNDGTGTISFTSDMVVNNFATNYGVLYLSGTNAGDNTFSGNISDTSGFSKFAIGKFGAGKWILSGTNTYEGNPLIAAGTLSVNTIANIGTPQPLGIGSAFQLGVGGGNANGTLLYTGGAASTDKQVQIGAAAGNAPGSTGGGSIVNDGSGALTFTNPTFNPATTGVTGTRTLTLGGSYTGAANEVQGVIQNNAAAGLVNLAKTGPGTWVLSGANTYTGTTTLTGGTLIANSSFSIGSGTATNTLIFNGGTLQAAGTISSPSTRPVTLTGTGLINTNGNAVSIAGVMSSTGGLAKSGLGTLTLSGANIFSGVTTVSAGMLELTNSLALQNSPLDTLSSIAGDSNNGLKTSLTALTLGGLTGNKNFADVFTNPAGGYSGVTALTLNPGSGAAPSYPGNIADGASGMTLTKSGAGVQILGAANPYTGATSITNGALVVSADGALGANAAGTTVAINTALGFSNVNYATTEAVSGSGTGGGTAQGGGITVSQRGFIQGTSGSSTFAGAITVNAGGTSRIGTQDGASLTLTGPITQATGDILFRVGIAGDFVTLSNAGNSFGGDSTVFTGTTTTGYAGVRLGINDALPTDRTISSFSGTNATFTALDLAGYSQSLNGLNTGSGAGALQIINQNTSTASTLTLNPTVDKVTTNTTILGGGGLGVISVVKSGAFTQTLSTVSTYTGTTTVSEGKLLVNGQLGNTAVSVTGTATIGGTGVLLSTLSLAGTSFLEVNLADPLQVDGNITFGSGFGIGNITGFDWDSVTLDSPITLLNTAQVFSSADIANFGLENAAPVGAFGRSAYFQNGNLQAVVVPETSAVSLLGLATLFTLRRRRTA